MRGIKSVDLLAIIDFLYYREANIYQENLDTFLNIAEELELKGLNGGGGNEEEMFIVTKGHQTSTKESVQTSNILPAKNETKIYSNFHQGNNFEDHLNTEKTVVIQRKDSSGELEELYIKIKAMIGRLAEESTF